MIIERLSILVKGGKLHRESIIEFRGILRIYGNWKNKGKRAIEQPEK